MFLFIVEVDMILQDPHLNDLDPQMVKLIKHGLYDQFSVNNNVWNTLEENVMRFAVVSYIILLQNQVEQLEAQMKNHLVILTQELTLF